MNAPDTLAAPRPPMRHRATPAGEIYPEAIDLAKVKAAHAPQFKQREVMIADGNTAAAIAALQMWRAVIFPGFPITPSTKWIETVASRIAADPANRKKVKLLEAEHAVADYLVGAAASCRDLVFATATSSVGLDHMTETTRSLGASGLGNVMIVDVYRATANFPLCIEGDPSDTLAHRDDGFIQVCARGKQQIYDTMIQMPPLGMHPAILTPTMPGYFGIKDSHKSGRLVLEPDAAIHAFQDDWIAPCPLPGLLNGDTAFGNCVTSRHFQGFKWSQRERMDKVLEVLPAIGRDFEAKFGRPGLAFFDEVGWPEDGRVDVAVVGMGPDFGTFEALRPAFEEETGLKVAGIAMRLLTPFPRAAVAERLARARVILVVNQAHHHGRGHLTLDVVDALAEMEKPPATIGAFAGLGGANVSLDTWRAMLDHAQLAVQGQRFPRALLFHEGSVL